MTKIIQYCGTKTKNMENTDGDSAIKQLLMKVFLGAQLFSAIIYFLMNAIFNNR